MHAITLIPGDGIGPEVTEATRRVLEATGAAIAWDEQNAGAGVIDRCGTPLPAAVLEWIRKNRVALKGPITTPVGTGFRSVNVSLRKELDLYANVRPCKTYAGIASRYSDIDLVIVRENTEDLYAGVEHMVGEDAAESIKIITRKGSERIVRYAFEYAVREKRRKVTAVHKANIMKCTDGLFLSVARAVALEYPSIAFEDMLVDAMCMKLVQSPTQYDVLVMPNLYGDIVSDLCSGLVGGLGVAPGVNVGRGLALFEAVHGSAPDLAGTNAANPTAMLLSGVLMLRHINESATADRVEAAIAAVLKEGKDVTADLGGRASTSDYADAVIAKMK